jgi:hypothetical protein
MYQGLIARLAGMACEIRLFDLDQPLAPSHWQALFRNQKPGSPSRS